MNFAPVTTRSHAPTHGRIPISGAQVFPASKLSLLSSLKPIEKKEEARKPILSKDASVVYLATREHGMPSMQAIEEANSRGLTLVPNKDIDELLNGKDEAWRAEEQFYPAWTGTFITYEVPGKPLGKSITHHDRSSAVTTTYIFNVPRKAQGKTNLAFAINHGFLQDGTPLISFKKIGENKFLVKIADRRKIKMLDIPIRHGYHLTDAEFGLPIIGEDACSYKLGVPPVHGSRCLWISADNYIGLIFRGKDDIPMRLSKPDYTGEVYFCRTSVVACNHASYPAAVLAYSKKE